VSFNVLVGESGLELDGSGISILWGAQKPLHGSVTVSTNGDATYTPDYVYSGTDSFQIQVINRDGLSSTKIVNATVSHAAPAPVSIQGPTVPLLAYNGAYAVVDLSRYVYNADSSDSLNFGVNSVSGVSVTRSGAMATITLTNATQNSLGSLQFTAANSSGTITLGTYATLVSDPNYGVSLGSSFTVGEGGAAVGYTGYGDLDISMDSGDTSATLDVTVSGSTLTLTSHRSGLHL